MKRHLGICPGRRSPHRTFRGDFGAGAAAIAVALSCLLSPLPASAEMRVKLKDGRVLTLPVDEDDIDAITYGDGKGHQQPAQRLADQIREDEERVRSARDAEARAAAAARAAQDAAVAAQAAAMKAREEADAARSAREQAEKLARVPPKPGSPPAPSASAPRTGPPPSAIAKRPDAKPPQVLKVGPGQKYAVPSEAAKAARDGDTIEIAAGTYTGDVAQWNASNLTIRGIGGRAHMDAQGKSLGGKAIWVLRGNDTVVENIEFSNCRVPDRNGAGIRLEGRNLTVRNGYFHDNEMGILTGHDGESEILIEGSEFARNLVDYPKTGSLGHNIYIGRVKSFTLRNSYSHGARWGHNVKTRARENRILYNRLADGKDGGASYIVDIAEGGTAWLIGNVIEQGPDADNWAMVSFAAEKRGADDRIALINNTMLNNRSSGVFLQTHAARPAMLINNILAGPGEPVKGPGELKANLIAKSVKAGIVGSLLGGGASPGTGDLAGNLVAGSAGLADPGTLDARLTEASPARDQGTEPGMVFDWPVRPEAQYVHPLKSEPRPNDGRMDIGAYEFAKK